MPGYARKTDTGWSFSPEAIRLLREFMVRFPQTFDYLCANPKEDKYYEDELFPDPEGCVLTYLWSIPYVFFQLTEHKQFSIGAADSGAGLNQRRTCRTYS